MIANSDAAQAGRYLGKTGIQAGLQCPRHLHQLVHNPTRAKREETLAMRTGTRVGEQARKAFAGGVCVARDGGADAALAQTQRLLDDPGVDAIFEAAFAADGIIVYVDVLRRAARGWELIEVKASTGVKDTHIDDVAIQLSVAGRAGLNVERAYLMHINGGYIHEGDGEYPGLFVLEEITAKARAHVAFIDTQIAALQEILAGAEPEVHPGPQCKQPYPCEFRDWCDAQDGGYPVALLPNAAAVVGALLQQGLYDLREVPAELLESDRHLWVRNVTVTGRAELRPGAAHTLEMLAYPRYYLDFECIQFAIPAWRGTSPYQQLPFQWSCHIEREGQALEHHEFLDTCGQDPRREFAERLLAACGERGPIVVYNQSFEKRIIRELADSFADLRVPLLALPERVFDLLPVVRAHYYHPHMKGSWSIKNVLECLVPELSYRHLAGVRDGTQAQAAYLDIVFGDLSVHERQTLTENLRRYCKRDTFAMYAIVERLQTLEHATVPEGTP
ncbi:MAG: DUF2779 domain-containing protein [Pseudomonadota bacterium]|nr:MAG: DUF2779 domain-containing protein [Pseudomonadota bacterium]